MKGYVPKERKTSLLCEYWITIENTQHKIPVPVGLNRQIELWYLSN